MKTKKILLEILGIFVIVSCMIGIFFLGFALGSPEKSSNDYSFNYTYQPNITYKNMTIEQIMNVEKIMSQVNPLYFNLQEKIIFDNSNESLINIWNGLNSGNGKIITIHYQTKYIYKNGSIKKREYNERHFKETICHELLHTYITEIDRELEEEIVEDLDGYLFCFR